MAKTRKKKKKKSGKRKSGTKRWWQGPFLVLLRTTSWLIVIGALFTGLLMGVDAVWNVFTEHPSFALTPQSFSFNTPEYVKEREMKKILREHIDEVIGEDAHIFDRNLTENIEERLLDLPWPAEIKEIRRLLPNKLLARIDFRKPAGKVMFDRRIYFVDTDGYHLPDSLYSTPWNTEAPRMPIIVHERLGGFPPRVGRWDATALPVGARLCRFLIEKNVLNVLDIKRINVTDVGTEARKGDASDVLLETGGGATVRWGTTEEYNNIEGLERRVDEPTDEQKLRTLLDFSINYPDLEGIRHIDLRFRRVTYTLESS